MTTTTNLAEFGQIELDEAIKIIVALQENGLPDEFRNGEVQLMFNKKSGDVFLTNEDFQVCVEVQGKLESFYYCAECGHEGFEENAFTNDEKNICDKCYDKQ